MRVVGPVMGIVWAVFLLQPWQVAWDAPARDRADAVARRDRRAGASFAWVVLTRAGPHGSRPPGPEDAAFVLAGRSCSSASRPSRRGRRAWSASCSSASPRSSCCGTRGPCSSPSSRSAVDRRRARGSCPAGSTIDDLVISVVLASRRRLRLHAAGAAQPAARARAGRGRGAGGRARARADRPRHARHPRPLPDRHRGQGGARRASCSTSTPTARGPRSRRSRRWPARRSRTCAAWSPATRAVTLAGELAGARQAFDAAGIEADVPGHGRPGARRPARALRVGGARGHDERAAARGGDAACGSR